VIASDCEITNEQSRLFHEAIGFSEVNRREGSLMKQFEVEDGTRVTMHGQELVFGETIFAARSSNDILEAPDALSQRLDEDGYLVIRGFHNPETISRARTEILDHVVSENLIDTGHPIENAIASGTAGPYRFQDKHVKQWRGFLDVVGGTRTMGFFEQLLGGPVLTLDHKWLRATRPGRNSNAHCDGVYVGAGTKQLYTVWTALNDITLDMGPLCFCLESHKHERLKETYGHSDAHDDMIEGWFSTDPHDVRKTLDVRWVSTPFSAGDVVIFGMFMLHGSLDNQSDRYRLSSDTRYQLASESVDTRHMGIDPDVIPKANPKSRKHISQLRTEWGLESRTSSI
jgi:ectoine hydroxylase-related dioxygenase (phytanoyl-CoA dioxygenase family)